MKRRRINDKLRAGDDYSAQELGKIIEEISKNFQVFIFYNFTSQREEDCINQDKNYNFGFLVDKLKEELHNERFQSLGIKLVKKEKVEIKEESFFSYIWAYLKPIKNAYCLKLLVESIIDNKSLKRHPDYDYHQFMDDYVKGRIPKGSIEESDDEWGLKKDF